MPTSTVARFFAGFNCIRCHPPAAVEVQPEIHEPLGVDRLLKKTQK